MEHWGNIRMHQKYDDVKRHVARPAAFFAANVFRNIVLSNEYDCFRLERLPFEYFGSWRGLQDLAMGCRYWM